MDDVLLAKKVSLERCVRQIRLYRSQSGDVPFSEDFLRQDVIANHLDEVIEYSALLLRHEAGQQP